MTLEQIMKAYKRFITNRDTHSGIYLYPQYESDLDAILEFVATVLLHFYKQKQILKNQ